MAFLFDGFPTIVNFGMFTSGLYFKEKTVTPPGFDGGGPNDVTTMRNINYRTMYPKNLKTLTEITETAAYDPAQLDVIYAYVNFNQRITVNFSDKITSITFWGYIDKFKPNDVKEGEQPTATVTIQPTNVSSSGAEVAPLILTAGWPVVPAAN